MNISVIIVNYRTPDHVREVLPLISDHPKVKEIVVVDNHFVEPFVTDIQGVDVITSESNIGFGGAINLAIKTLSTHWVLLLNPDVRPGPNCVSELINAAQLTGSPLLGPRFHWDHQRQFRLPPSTGGSVWFESAMNFASKNRLEKMLVSQYWNMHHDWFWSMQEPFYQSYVSGACMLVDVSRLALASGDLMDPGLFLYFEDTDLCARAINAGFHPVCVPQAEAVHYWNQSPEPDTPKAQLFSSSSEVYFHKHFGSFKRANISGAPLQIDCNDLGKLSDPPLLDLDLLPGAGYCELALSKLFVPFAQAKITDGAFQINPALWRYMAKGDYFLRTRSRTMGDDQVWKFRKI